MSFAIIYACQQLLENSSRSIDDTTSSTIIHYKFKNKKIKNMIKSKITVNEFRRKFRGG